MPLIQQDTPTAHSALVVALESGLHLSVHFTLIPAGTGGSGDDYIVMNDTVLDDARKAFLFINSAHTLSAVTFDRDGRNLPHPRVCQWNFAREFQLGVQEVTPFGIDPEPILRGMAANGYFVWPVENMQPFGTSQ